MKNICIHNTKDKNCVRCNRNSHLGQKTKKKSTQGIICPLCSGQGIVPNSITEDMLPNHKIIVIEKRPSLTYCNRDKNSLN